MARERQGLDPRCPVCGHFLVTDGGTGWICGKRGGCGSEWAHESVVGNPEPFGLSPPARKPS